MDDDLKAIKDGWESRDAAGIRSSSGEASLEDDNKVYALADEYVAAHTEEFAAWDNLSLDVLVKTLEEARDKGDEVSVWKIQAWLFHKFEPQNIGGTYQAQLRVRN